MSVEIGVKIKLEILMGIFGIIILALGETHRFVAKSADKIRLSLMRQRKRAGKGRIDLLENQKPIRTRHLAKPHGLGLLL